MCNLLFEKNQVCFDPFLVKLWQPIVNTCRKTWIEQYISQYYTYNYVGLDSSLAFNHGNYLLFDHCIKHKTYDVDPPIPNTPHEH
jgi:hypothetical protein